MKVRGYSIIIAPTMSTLTNVNANERADNALCVGIEPNTPPSEAYDGVSTRIMPTPNDTNVNWYALRATYNRERRAYDYLLENGCEVYWPTVKVMKLINGKKKKKEVSRIPNILFARGTFNHIKSFVYDNVHLPFLRFYYEEHRTNNTINRTPIIVPDRQMESLKIICNTDSMDVLMVPDNVDNFKKGDHVRIIGGNFKGIEGQVARWHGQQRVAIIIENLCTVATAYIPSAFLEKID